MDSFHRLFLIHVHIAYNQTTLPTIIPMYVDAVAADGQEHDVFYALPFPPGTFLPITHASKADFPTMKATGFAGELSTLRPLSIIK